MANEDRVRAGAIPRWLPALTALALAITVPGTLGVPAARAAFPVSNEKIAFMSTHDGNPEIYTVNPDGSGLARLTNSDVGDIAPAWSPDGTRIAFGCGIGAETDGGFRTVGPSDICVMDAEGRGLVRLTNDPVSDGEPTWSPDGSRIAFRRAADIYTMKPDGSDVMRLTTDPGASEPAWSPDGTKIAFTSYRDPDPMVMPTLRSGEIYAMNADGTGAVNLTKDLATDDRHPAWSPDGTRIAYDSHSSAGGEVAVWLMNPDGSAKVRLPPAPGNDSEPAWSPDGGKIAFTRYGDNLSDIFVRNADGTDAVAVTNRPGFDGNPDWQPTAKPFVTLRSGITERLYGAGVEVSWRADGTIASHEAEQSLNGGPFTPVAVEPGRVWYVLRDRSYRLRVRVVDTSGVSSPWATGPGFKVTAASPVLFDGRWTRAPDRTAIDGSTRYTTRAGARASLRFFGSSVAWVSSTALDRGRATVYIDGRSAKKVDLSGPVKVRRAVFAKWWPSSGWHTIEVVADGTTGRPRVDVDAFLVMKAQAPTRSYWTQTGRLPSGATFPIVHRLADGSVLVAGAWPSKVYRTGSGFWGSVVAWGEWSTTGPMVHQRPGTASVLLRDGRVLAAGGNCCGPSGVDVPWAEVFDPPTRTWAAIADMLHARSDPGLVVLLDGRVLAMGGLESGFARTATAEIYDPATGRWSPTASMGTARFGPLAARLPDGRVLVVGGSSEVGLLDSAEVYDPATGRWSPVLSTMSAARQASATTMTGLANGRILVVGGLDGADGCLASAEYYDPVLAAWRSAGRMSAGRCFHAATLTASGSVLVAGGVSDIRGPALSSAELYDPVSNTWTRAPDMAEAREASAAALLPSGDVLVAGGMDPGHSNGNAVSTGSELFHPVGRPPR